MRKAFFLKEKKKNDGFSLDSTLSGDDKLVVVVIPIRQRKRDIGKASRIPKRFPQDGRVRVTGLKERKNTRAPRNSF